MVVVAVPGGSSPGLGRSIVKALLESGRHTPIVLSRLSSETPKWLTDLGVEVRKVDYTRVDSLVKGLVDVHTVVCTLLAKDGTWLPSQINLLSAGLQAGILRFAPAEFGCGPEASRRVGLLAAQTPIWNACRGAKVDNPGFEWAGFHLGLFMNYLGNGCENEKEALAGKSDDGEFIFYMKDMKAIIPLREDGGIPMISMMEIGDVGRFVAAACDLPPGSWQEDFSMVGETLKMDEVVRIIEEVRGKMMNVTYRTIEEIREERKKNSEDEMRVFWLELEETSARDRVGEGVIQPVLNRLCPGVRPMNVKEYISKFWSEP